MSMATVRQPIKPVDDLLVNETLKLEQRDKQQKEQEQPAPICPIRWLAFAMPDNNLYLEDTRCIGDECAWHLICQNLSNLAKQIDEGVHPYQL